MTLSTRLVPAVPSVPVPNLNLVAISPAELVPVQGQIVGWCRAKILALAEELKEHRADLKQAQTMHWKRSGWVKAIGRTKRRMIYYAKLQAALKAGYLIVPNFNVDILAVRVDRVFPKRETNCRGITTTPEVLPPGQGRYVDDKLIVRDTSYDYKKVDGTTGHRTQFTAEAYDDEIDFPGLLIKPQVLAATDRAMAMNLFDRIGVVRGTGKRSDPIVVGQIIHADETHVRVWNSPKCVSFFIAWYLNTADL